MRWYSGFLSDNFPIKEIFITLLLSTIFRLILKYLLLCSPMLEIVLNFSIISFQIFKTISGSLPKISGKCLSKLFSGFESLFVFWGYISPTCQVYNVFLVLLYQQPKGQVLKLSIEKLGIATIWSFFQILFSVRLCVGGGCQVQGRQSLELQGRCSVDGRLSSHEVTTWKLSS